MVVFILARVESFLILHFLPILLFEAFFDVKECFARDGSRLDEHANQEADDYHDCAGCPVEHFVFDNAAVEKQHSGNDGNEKDDQVANALDLVTVLAFNIVLILFQNLAAVGVPPRFKLLFGHS